MFFIFLFTGLGIDGVPLEIGDFRNRVLSLEARRSVKRRV